MDISAFGMAGVAAITVICYLVGWIVKVSGLDNKWIPVIVGVCGADRIFHTRYKRLGIIRRRTKS